MGSRTPNPPQLNALESNKLGLSSITKDIREKVAADPTHQQKMVGDVILDGKQVPAVFIGTGVDVPTAGRYDLYYIYPMTQELRTMSLISTAFGIAGLILTFLVGAVAWVVTKQVVSPVRRAAEVVEAPRLGQAQRTYGRRAARTTSPCSARRSTRWPTASRRRSASSKD